MTERQITALGRRLAREAAVIEHRMRCRLPPDPPAPPDERADALDRAVAEITHGTHVLLDEVDRRRLHQLQLAWRRLQSGRFGTCYRCASAIELRRLLAAPETALCITCARELERVTTAEEKARS